MAFPEFAAATAAPAFARRLADTYGEQFACNFCGQSLRRRLEKVLPAP